MAALLEVAGLNSFYGRAHILHDVSFALAPGEVLVLLGRNGAGKSTVLKSLIGLVRPAAGRIRLAGRDFAGEPPPRIARAGIGYVPEERRIFADLTVLENLAVGRRPARPGRPAWTHEALFTLFPNLRRLAHRRGGEMSGGEQQMLAIARTLMGNPLVLLLDAPSEGLAPLIVEQMAGAITTLKRQGVTVLLAEQNLHFARGVADRAMVIETGVIGWTGAMAALPEDAALSGVALG